MSTQNYQHYGKIIEGTHVTKQMIERVGETLDLATKAFSIPSRFKLEMFRSFTFRQAMKNVKKPQGSTSTFLESQDYLLHALSQPTVDEAKVLEALERIEAENKSLAAMQERKGSLDSTYVENFQKDAVIVGSGRRLTNVRIQLDTGSKDSFVSEETAKRAKLQVAPTLMAPEYFTMTGESAKAQSETQVDWYATNQAVTRTTKCYVLKKLPVDMVIGSKHITEYNMLAINRAEAALLFRSNRSKEETVRLEREANQRDEQNRVEIERQKSYNRARSSPLLPQNHVNSPNLVGGATQYVSPMPTRSAPPTPPSRLSTATQDSSPEEPNPDARVLVPPGHVAALRRALFTARSASDGPTSDARR